MDPVTQVIIPAAGAGRRMAPLTDFVPKVFLPVVDAPLVVHALREAQAAGMRRACVVVAPGMEHLPAWRTCVPDLEVALVVQEQPRGLADALLLAQGWLRPGPVAALNPDNLHTTPGGALATVVRHRDPERATVALVPVTEANAPRLSASGRVELVADGAHRFRITRLLAKERGARLLAGRDRYKMTGRYVLPEGFLAEFARDAGGGEHDDTPTLMRWAQEGRLAGVATPGDLFDCGNPDGYRAAWRYFLAAAEGASPRG